MPRERPRSFVEGLEVETVDIATIATGYFARGNSAGTGLYGFNLFGAANTWQGRQSFGEIQRVAGAMPPTTAFDTDTGMIIASGTGSTTGTVTIGGQQTFVGAATRGTSTGIPSVIGAAGYGGLLIGYSSATTANATVEMGGYTAGSIMAGFAKGSTGGSSVKMGTVYDALATIGAGYSGPSGYNDVAIDGNFSIIAAGATGGGTNANNVNASGSLIGMMTYAGATSTVASSVDGATKGAGIFAYTNLERAGFNAYVDINMQGGIASWYAKSPVSNQGRDINIDIGYSYFARGTLSCFYMRPRGVEEANVDIQGRGNAFIGYARRGTIGITSAARGSMVVGQAGANNGANAGTITMSGSNSIIVGRALSGNSITVSGLGSGAFGNTDTGSIVSSADNCWQFGPGTNAEADSLQVGSDIRIFGAGQPAGAAKTGDIYVYNNFVYIYTTAVTGGGPYAFKVAGL